MKLNKIFGWIIFFIGLGIIFWAIFNSYDIFTAKAPAPEIFKLGIEKEVETPAKGKTPTTQEELQKEMEKMIGEQLKGILPTDALPKLLNLIAWSIFAGILFFGGGQISGLGIKLIKG